jgi:hypothetical protein
LQASSLWQPHNPPVKSKAVAINIIRVTTQKLAI